MSAQQLLVLDTDPGRCCRLVELLSSTCPGVKVVAPTARQLTRASPYHPPAALRRVVLAPAEGAADEDVLQQLCAVELLPRYVHKVLPVCGSGSGGAAPDESALLAAIMEAAGLLAGDLSSVRLQTAAATANQALMIRIGTALAAEGLAFSPTGYSHVLSVDDNRSPEANEADDNIVEDESAGPGALLWGLVPRAATAGWFALKKAAKAAGEAAPCRAQFKLKEAMTLPEIDQGLAALRNRDGPQQGHTQPEPEPEPESESEPAQTKTDPCPGVVAMDLGAAPGGWTEVLSLSPLVRRVLAVDPAELCASLLFFTVLHLFHDYSASIL